MAELLQCYRCGADLSGLSLPLSRSDLCPGCGNYLHACRMCTNFDRHVARQCLEDDAEEVMDKETANFCDWFEPATGRYGGGGDASARAKARLDSLFGDAPATDSDDDDDASRAAEDLFR